MANTVNINIPVAKQWTLARTSTTAENLIMSIAGGGQHCVSDVEPSSTLIGHRFTGDLVNLPTVSGESVYIYADSPTVVIITPTV
jgi:hypothetical protein